MGNTELWCLNSGEIDQGGASMNTLDNDEDCVSLCQNPVSMFVQKARPCVLSTIIVLTLFTTRTCEAQALKLLYCLRSTLHLRIADDITMIPVPPRNIQPWIGLHCDSSLNTIKVYSACISISAYIPIQA